MGCVVGLPGDTMETKELEQNLSLLKEIADRFPSDSPEVKVIRLAAEALLFAFHKETRAEFVKFLSDRDQPLTSEQILHLRAIGIDPDTSE
jgi:hypothetical protein